MLSYTYAQPSHACKCKGKTIFIYICCILIVFYLMKMICVATMIRTHIKYFILIISFVQWLSSILPYVFKSWSESPYCDKKPLFVNLNLMESHGDLLMFLPKFAKYKPVNVNLVRINFVINSTDHYILKFDDTFCDAENTLLFKLHFN